MSEHQHQWEMQIHLDGCHFYSSTYRCECGARLETFDEREPMAGESYGALWMDTDCPRCRELLEGAESVHEKELIPA